MRVKILTIIFFVVTTVMTINAQTAVVDTEKEETIFHNDGGEKIYPNSNGYVDKFAEFPNGETAMRKYILENLIYPSDAKEADIQGVVYMSFVVEKDGSVTDPKVLKGFHVSCDNEVIRLVNSFPKWKPALKNGAEVRSQFNIPFRFSLTNTKKSKNKKKK